MKIHIGILLFFLAMYIISSKGNRKKVFCKSKVLIPFYTIGSYIIEKSIQFFENKKTGGMFQRLITGQKVIEDLKILNPAVKGTEKVKLYYVEKTALTLLIIFVANLGGILSQLSYHTQGNQFDGKSLTRNDYGEGEKEENLLVTAGEDLVNTPFLIRIKDKKYTKSEIDQLFLEAVKELDIAVLAENNSRDEVRSDLNLILQIPDIPIQVEWEIEDSTIINQEGKIQEAAVKEGGTLVKLRAILTYENYEYEYSTYVNVYPKIQTEGEKILRRLEEEIGKSQEETRMEEAFKLPEKIGKIKLTWEKEQEKDGIYMLLIGTAASLLLFFGKDRELSKEIEKRKVQMLLDYAEVVSKLTLLLGAGMTVRGAWKKIVMDYKERIGKSGTAVRFAYEEMMIAYYEMEGGVAERTAYDRFGKRCKIQRYLKLSTLLAQNLKKGSRGLAQMLEYEVIDAFEERKNQAKRMGEEAGTKLLFPMFIMLAIVIVIVVVPAFLSFGI